MDKETIVKEVKFSIVEVNAYSEDEIHLESSLKDDLQLDSLDQVELIMKIEKKWDISISDNEALDLIVVQDLVNLVEIKIK